MNTRTTTCAALLALAAALTACNSGSDNKAASPTSTTPTPAASTTEPTPTRQPLTFGSTWEFEGTSDNGDPVQGAVTVLSYKQGVKAAVSADQEFSTDGYVWAALQLKTCSTQGSFWATTEPWTLSYKDGTRIEPSSTTYDDFPRPEFPVETKVTTGQCVKGNVVYPVPGDQRPATVVYAPDGIDTPTEWTVPKS